MAMTTEEREKRVTQIRRLIEKGYSLQMLAKHYGVREENIRVFLKRNGLKTDGQKQHEENHRDE